MKRIASALACFSGACGFAAWLLPSGPAIAASVAAHHMIVAAEPDAAEAGLMMLRSGGSAVDAAIAAQMVLTLEEPQSSGIGGGAYLIVSDGAQVQAYDGRETAPASARPEMFLDRNGRPRPHEDAVPGGLSVGVPGAVRVLALAHAAHGKLPWARLFEPAISLAENGFKVPPRLAIELADGGPDLAAMPDIRASFFHPDGTPIQRGEVWHNEKLARTFRLIAQGGSDAFYNGAIASDIVNAVAMAPMNPAAALTL